MGFRRHELEATSISMITWNATCISLASWPVVEQMTASLQSAPTEVLQSLDQLPPDSIVFGGTTQTQALRSRLERAAALDMPVLIEGESGTGKDIIARMLHRRSPWSCGVFVKARCSCIPDTFDTLLESSADVIENGPLSTVRPSQTGCYGTLFLDEISESSAALQTKLLRLLQEGQLCRISLKGCKLNLRLLCATNCGLEDAAERGTFRRDLLYRINVLTMRMPPLRERKVDIPDLINHFLNLFANIYHCTAKRPSRHMLQSLLAYSWPGNIRELENLMRRYVLFGCEESVSRDLLNRAERDEVQALSEPGAVSLKEMTRKAVRELERDAILKVLQANQWNRKRAACVLNISYRALLYKIKDAGMAAGQPGRSTEVQPAAKAAV